MVARKLDKKLKENLRDTRNCLFTSESSYRYKLLAPYHWGYRMGQWVYLKLERIRWSWIFVSLFYLLIWIQIAVFISYQRPLLVLLDRNVDIATPLHHTWTYQALAHDVLNLSLNRIVLDDKGKKKICDLDSNDSFWMAHKGRYCYQ